MIKSIVLKLFLLAISFNLIAQTDFQKGFIIKTTGDTIHGWVDSRSEMRNMQVCTFKEQQDAEVQIFLPGEITGYRFSESGKFYVTRYLETDHVNDTVFVEFLLEGMSNLYYYSSVFYQAYFIESMEGRLIELRKDDVEIVRDGRTYKVTNERYKGVLMAVWSDQPLMRNEITNTRLRHKPLIELAKRYHDYVCYDEECIIFERFIPKVKITLRPYIGYNYSNITFESEEQISNMNFNPSIRPSFGIDMDFILPRVNDRYALVTSVMLSEEYFYGEHYYGDYYYKMPMGIIDYWYCHITNTNLSTRIGIKYTYPSRIIRPTIMAGLNNTFILSTKNDFAADMIIDGEVSSITFPIDIFDKYINGVFVASGIDYEIGKVKVFSNISFMHLKRSPSDRDVKRIDVYTFGLSTGVSF